MRVDIILACDCEYFFTIHKYTAVNISHAHTRSSRLEDVSPNQSSKAFGGKSRDHTESSALFALLSHFSSPGQLILPLLGGSSLHAVLNARTITHMPRPRTRSFVMRAVGSMRTETPAPRPRPFVSSSTPPCRTLHSSGSLPSSRRPRRSRRDPRRMVRHGRPYLARDGSVGERIAPERGTRSREGAEILRQSDALRTCQ